METLANIVDSPLREDGAFVFHHPPKFLWSRTAFSPPSRDWGEYNIYLHVPFCRKICNFCTFERRLLAKGGLDWFTRLVSLEMELVAATDSFERAQVCSVYLGGGTASLLPNPAIAQILSDFRGRLGLGDDVEVTLECEPGTKSTEDFKRLHDIGINRISIGVQTFADSILQTLNRGHKSIQSERMVHDAKDAGMDIVHIDLMYGLPGQTPMQWQEDVERAVELGVQHISAYPLIVFQHQLLSRSILAGTVPEQPSSALIYEMQQYASSVFERAGFERYSLTEFATPGHRCRYVTSNWNGSDYLGFGPGAYSRKGNELWENSVLHSEYEEALRNLRRPIGRDINMSPRQALERDLSLGLCLISVDTSNLEKRTSLRVSEEFGNLIDELQQQRLVRFENGTLSLTTYGIRHATHVMKLFTSQSTSITRRDQWQSRQVAS